MQKKLIVLAVAAALTAPALAMAEDSVVVAAPVAVVAPVVVAAPAVVAEKPKFTWYGVADADVEQVKSDKVAATAPGTRGRVTSNASRLGVKGEENVGEGLTAFFQVETRVNLMGNETTTTGTGVGATQTNIGVFNGMRNSNIGLKGDFGTAFIGNWDTPFKVSHNKVELFDNSSIATNTALLGAGPARFNLRQNSSVQYWSPVMSGIQLKGAYSTVNATVDVNGATGAAASAASNLGTPNLMSFSAAFDQDGIYVALATEQHKNFTAATTVGSPKESANRLVAAYSLDGMQVGLTVEGMTATTAAGVDTKKNTYALSGKYAMDASTFGASYTQATDLTVGGATTANSGAKQISLRYGYSLTKRSEVYGMYTRLANKAVASYNFADVATLASSAGATLSGFGVGVRHTF